MMTLLFGFFVILYSFSTPDKKKISEFGKEIAESMASKTEASKIIKSEENLDKIERQLRAFQLLADMLQLGHTPMEAVENLEKADLTKKQTDAAKAMMKEALSDSIGITKDADGVSFSPSKPDLVNINLAAGLLFEPGKAILKPEATGKLKELSEAISKVRDFVEVEVIGHTDSSPPLKNATYNNNWGLSAARAGSVADALVGFGIAPDRMLTRGMGSIKPVYPEFNASGKPIATNKARNRRVEIIVRRISSPTRSPATTVPRTVP
jgi:chemotaxis protein MotB